MKLLHLRKLHIAIIFASLLLFYTIQNTPFSPEQNQENITKQEEVQSASPNELFIKSYNVIKNNYWDKEICESNLPRWKKRYKGKIKDYEDAKVAINSMLQSLNDPYSKFMDEDEFRELNTNINSKIYGIGINIASEAGKTIIINVIKDTPADIAGLKQGDLILKVNGENMGGKSLFQVATCIKSPEDKTVNLEILRNNKKLLKQINKTEIKVKTVKSDIIDKEIGYIRISSFISNETPMEFIDAMNKIKDTNALILDLRGNTGGLFQNALFIADLFLDNKNVVSVLGRGGKKSIYKTHNMGYLYSKPMAVLVDSESASATEILSGALKDNKRAVLIGTRTFGKGLVQKVIPMPNGTGINLTIARYLTPMGYDINKKGIEPDYKIQLTDNDFATNTDRQLNFAIKTLHSEIERRKIANK